MNDREALEAALDLFTDFDEWMKAKTSPNSVEEIEVAEAMRTLATAARKHLAQQPEKCGTCDGDGKGHKGRFYSTTGRSTDNIVVDCPTCHGRGTVYPPALMERLKQGTTFPEAMVVMFLDALNDWKPDDYHAWQRKNEAPTVYSDPT